MSGTENRSIKKGMQHLILCEGKDECLFMIYYLNSEALSYNKQYSETVQVEDFGGNEDLCNALKSWSNDPNFLELKSLVVVRDAEKNAQAAVDSIINAFKNADLPVPPRSNEFKTGNGLKTGFFLFPKCSSEPVNGTLEDLCFSILMEKEAPISEIETFLSDLQTHKNRTFPRPFKTKLHTYFSITDKFVSLKIGEAAKAGAFDWSSPELEPIRIFLDEMVR